MYVHGEKTVAKANNMEKHSGTFSQTHAFHSSPKDLSSNRILEYTKHFELFFVQLTKVLWKLQEQK